MTDDIAKIAAGLTKARRDAIKADKTAFPSFLGTLVALSGIAAFFGYAASFWFGLGALISCAIALWEAGRNLQIEEAAVRAYLLENTDAA